jgi:hypothetical protein
MGVVYVYPSLIIALIAIACTQIDKLNAAILDIRQQHITPQRGQEMNKFMKMHTVTCNQSYMPAFDTIKI